jgi:hypothetical protein
MNSKEFSTNRVGLELEKKINEGISAFNIGNWAYQIYCDHCLELDPNLEKILIDLFTMTAGPQYEYSEEKLREIAEYLIYEESDRMNIRDRRYDNRLFGKELKSKLQSGVSIHCIADWAHDILYADFLDPSPKEIVYRLALMDASSEMEYTKENLMSIAERLIKNESVL